MAKSPIARKPRSQLVRIGMCIVDQFLQGINWAVRFSNYNYWSLADENDVCKVTLRIEAHVLVHKLVGSSRPGGCKQYRISVGLGLGDYACTNVATGSASVVDDNGLTDRFA